jgi:hypothetical protein
MAKFLVRQLQGLELNLAFAIAVGEKVEYRQSTAQGKWSRTGWCNFRGNTARGDEIWYLIPDYTKMPGTVWNFLVEHKLSIGPYGHGWSAQVLTIGNFTSGSPHARYGRSIHHLDPLIAVMQCIIAGMYGDEIELEDY